MKTTGRRIGLILFLAGFIFSAAAQKTVVSGTVFDATDKSPLIGATVIVKGTNSGAVTDIDGKYRIETEKGKRLVFNYVGYKSQEVKVAGPKLDVYLKPDVAALEEVVVTGYGVQTRKAMTGSVTAVADRSYHHQPFFIPSPREVNTEEYEAFNENRFLSALKNPLSTFSLDVDAASYGNVRRMVNQGQMPAKDAVRVEEMINPKP